jgi:hypothetical protein
MFKLVQSALWAMLTGYLVCSLFHPEEAAAQEPPLPPASELIDRFVDAIGGSERVLAVPSTRIRSEVDLPGMGAQAEFELIMTAEGRMATTMSLPGMGEMRTGFTGEVGWAMDAMAGPRLMEGKELAGIQDQANPLSQTRDARLFSLRETVERTEMGGQPCYLVRLVWVSGRESFDCYHPETGLVVAAVDTSESPMGSLEITAFYREYREFDGVLLPVHTVQEILGDRIEIRVLEVAFGDVEPSDLAPPAPVRALMEAQEGER